MLTSLNKYFYYNLQWLNLALQFESCIFHSLFFMILSLMFLCYAVHTEAVVWSRVLSSAASTINRFASPGRIGVFPSAESSPVSFHPKISRRKSSRKHISGLHVACSSWCL